MPNYKAMPSKQRQVVHNPIARAPILRKGGVHEQSKTGKRMSDKQSLKRTLCDWLKGEYE
ncbi:hypothetical protein [Beggiatoa leptomitoformis]|uniref:Uncharacterized protein n=1 Tax=Beggiatoa leptomitoformis TaxID=288004 RepID=A0A2N9YDW1_9GAMM|nr:hypothetical protein [Beggiatoa leptomitoformis]ALG68933.1 hypothetical protein AL038_16055 [Beggiatoa leptomitoformis]AUI68683.1 hypothetical protein BLE401_08195 [Beggiatoa leptomitoformis]